LVLLGLVVLLITCGCTLTVTLVVKTMCEYKAIVVWLIVDVNFSVGTPPNDIDELIRVNA